VLKRGGAARKGWWRVTCRGVAGQGLCISSDCRGGRANIPAL